MYPTPSSNSQIANHPQQALNEFWETLVAKSPSRVTRILPSSLDGDLPPRPSQPGTWKGRNAAESYKAAAAECRANVRRIVQECRRTNEKFTDPEFDINDLPDKAKNCLYGLKHWYEDRESSLKSAVGLKEVGTALSTLIQANVLTRSSALVDIAAASRLLTNADAGKKDGSGPRSVHRVEWIFDNPHFEIGGFDSSEVIQGSNGDCWFIAAVATICSNPELMKKVCVERDEACGVYGFVFYRDGEWIWTVVDDNLYLRNDDFDALGDRYDPTGAKETEYKRSHQTGSKALHFASCGDNNETWLPLLEKAYAKVHGDYDAIAGGISGEAVEDLTGGVTTKILTNRVLSRERLWEDLLQINKQFLFSAASSGSNDDGPGARRGLALSHAYSIVKAVEADDEHGKSQRLVLVRNPWGKRANAAIGEWTGPWADGSREWTPYWMEKLEHKFGDDGLFWMSYADLLQRFNLLDRTRLFGENWSVVQRWTSVPVAWVAGYSRSRFSVEVKEAGPAVFVLCQLDDRYIRGLEGQYVYNLEFILQRQNAEGGDPVVRVRGAWFGNRAISAEVDLEAGTYEVLPKVEASRNNDALEIHEVIMRMSERNPNKLRQIGLNYDLAYAKCLNEGLEEEEEEERSEKKANREETVDRHRQLAKGGAKDETRFKAWLREVKAEGRARKRERMSRQKRVAPAGRFGSSEPLAQDERHTLWNAVCVIGLRVYTQGTVVNINLNKAEERAKKRS